MSLSSKITDEEMRFFQFKARQLYLLRKEDHEWNEFCKRNTCTCCSCETNTVPDPKVNKEVGVQSSPKKSLPTSSRSTGITSHRYNKNLPQTLNEIKTKLEKIDLTLSEIKVPAKSEVKEVTKPKEIFHQRLNTLTFPLESDMAESVKSVINERKMQLIQDSLKMSVQRLQSAALRSTRPNSNVKIKKKNSGYFISRDLEKQRTAARRAYLASLEKTTLESNVLPPSTRVKTDAKRKILKPKSLKATTTSNLRKFNKSNNQKEEPTLVESNQLSETKDENIETAIDSIIDDILGETVLAINKIKQSKSAESSTAIQNMEPVPNHECSRNIPMDSDFKEAEAAMIEHFQNKLEKIRKNLHCARKGTDQNDSKLKPVEIKSIPNVATNATKSEQLIFPDASSSIHLTGIGEIKNMQPVRDLSIDSIKAKQISKCRNEYWSYMERMSRTKKGNFDPWALSNLVAESLLDDCLQEIAEELQDVPALLIADLYDQEFLQSV